MGGRFTPSLPLYPSKGQNVYHWGPLLFYLIALDLPFLKCPNFLKSDKRFKSYNYTLIFVIIVCLANCTAFQAIWLVQMQSGPCNFLPSCTGYKPIRFFKFAISANQVAWIDVTWQKFSICENCIATFHSYISKNRYYNNWRQLNQDRAGHYKFIEFLAGKEQFLVMMLSLMLCI